MACVADQVADHPTWRLDAFEECESLPVAMRLSPDRRPVRGVLAAGEINDGNCRDQERDQRGRRQQRRLALVLRKSRHRIGCQVSCFDTRAIEAPARQRSTRTAFRDMRPSRRERVVERRLWPQRRQNHPVEPDSIDSR